jgi:hypothetical protein
MDWKKLKNQGSEHYKTGGIEPVDLYVAGNMFRNFALASIIKYAFRCREEKARSRELIISDMDKVIDYAQKLKSILGGK